MYREVSLEVIMPPFALGIVLYWETFSPKIILDLIMLAV